MTNDHRISRIETLWSVVRRAHGGVTRGGGTLDVQSAQQQMLDRYGGAVRRYLLGAVRNAEAADELYQEFALRFIKGDYAGADAEKGRFRSFLKTVLFRLVAEHHRRKRRNAVLPFGTQVPEPADESPPEQDEFTNVWSEELLKQAWDALNAEEQSTGRPLFTVMRAKVDAPQMRSHQLAETVSSKLGREISTSNLRVMLHRARERFGDLLLEAVSHSIDTSDPERLEDELIALGLIEYCRPALERRREASSNE